MWGRLPLMKNPRIAHLNRLLRDHLGTGSTGLPLYKWMHSRDREMFCYISRSELSGRTAYEFIPQVNEQRWVLGRWLPPPREQAWEMQFHGEAPYPRNGYYVAASTPSDPLFLVGVEPNERITMYIIGLRKKQMEMGQAGIMRSFQEAQAYTKREKDSTVDAILRDRWTNCEPKVPGAREILTGA